MSRTYFTPQAGRQGKSGVKKEDEWGTTTSKAEFRGYEPAEMRSVRHGPSHTKPLLQDSSMRGTQPRNPEKQAPRYDWKRMQDQYPDHSQTMVSAVTASEQSGKRSSSGSRAEKPALNSRADKPAWATIHERPIAERSFDASSSYNSQQDLAQQARHGYFPYRDEFAPRSKRLLYELAHQRISRDSVASGSTADSASAFTISTGASKQSATRSAARSQSEGSLAASSHCSGSSSRLGVGIARRRWEAQYRSPSFSHFDKDWLDEKHEKEGPAGLTCANYIPSYYKNTFRQYAERANVIGPLLGGFREDEIKK